MSNLDRFTTAQDQAGSGFAAALAEIRAGGKRGHWIWYVWPQLAGLGSSPMSRTYAIRDEDEAIAYLHDPLLRARLLRITTAVADQLNGPGPASLEVLMGSSIDAQKLVSSLTLFRHVARTLHATEGLDEYGSLAAAASRALTVAASQGYPPCGHTLAHLRERV